MAHFFANKMNKVKTSLAKVQGKAWAEPLGQTLSLSGKVVDACGGFLPGAGIISGALAFGAELLDPTPTMKDLSEELKLINQHLQNTSLGDRGTRAMEKVAEEIQDKLREELSNSIRPHLQAVIREVADGQDKLSDEIRQLQSAVEATFQYVKFRDGLETVESAFEVFLEMSSQKEIKEFENYSFELKTVLKKSLKPSKIEEYLTEVQRTRGVSMTQTVMDYVLLVRAKNLMMCTHINIYNGEHTKAEEDFNLFNKQYEAYCNSFKKVTGSIYQPGQQPEIPKPTLQVRPSVREASSTTASDKIQLRVFLEKWNLTEIYEQLSNNGITLNDLPDITHQDLKDAGIQAFQHRKKLLGAIRENSSSGSTRTEPDPTNNTEVTRRQLASIAISSDPVPDFPTTLTVRSDQGPAGEEHWEKMGEYTKSELKHNNKPVWTNWDQSRKIYYHSGEARWSIGPSYTQPAIKSAKPGLPSPLSVGTGWLYYTHATGDTADTLLTVTEGPPVYPATVTVTSTGPAGQRWPSSMGVFTRGEASRSGRPVWRNTEDRYFCYDGASWMIGPDFTKNAGGIQSARPGLVGLDTQWEYWDGKEFTLDKTIHIF